MKKLLPFTIFTFLTAFSVTSQLPVMAGGCSSSSNKASEIKCDKDDKECQTKNAKEFDLKKAIKS